MCLAIPAQVCELLSHDPPLAMVDILGVRRKICMDLLEDAPAVPGDWVLVHVGFAMGKISAEEADEQLKLLSMLGESDAARGDVEESP